LMIDKLIASREITIKRSLALADSPPPCVIDSVTTVAHRR
jgi:hypothetical protein